SAGTRPEIGFDINTAKPAYPMLRPHLGARPPFAPEHSGAPFLKHSVTPQLPDGLCPSGARPIKYDVVAIQADVKYNKFDSDKAGQVFVRAQDRAAIDGGTTDPTSIVLRGNAGDCIDVTLTSALNEKEPGEIATGVHTKTNIHIHLVQFDVQGSDGVVAGYNYETTLRSLNGSYKSKPGQTLGALDPSAQTVTKIVGAVGIVGTDTTFVVESVKPFLDKTGMPKIGSTVGLGLGLTSIESGKLLAVNNATKTITIQGIHQVHNVGEFLGYEFVRYQWYPDVELGTVYFHDHVNGIDTWRHGLFGSLVIEPTGSRWLDPKRLNDNVPDSPTAHVVDIVPDGSVPGQKAYREAVLHFQDRACVNAVATACLNHEVPAMPNVVDEPAGFNLRAEPLHRRNAEKPFSSTAFYGTDDPRTAAVETNLLQGDPSTDTIEAYPGDKVVVRFLYAGQSMSRGVATFGMTGHRFQQEQFLTGGRVVDALSVAVSSQHNLELECGAGGCTRQPGDYLYFMTQPEFLQRGAWGLFRVHDPSDLTPIRALPDHAAPTVGFVPASAPVKRFDVSAIEGSVAHNPNAGIVSTMKRFVLDSELPQATDIATLTPPDPLVLRVSAGDLVEVHLTNRLASGRVGMHAALLSAGPADQGVEVGNGPTATARPGETIVYSWYADRELGVADLVSFADPVNDANEGLSGAIVVEPAGVAFTNATGPTADLALPNDLVAREQVLLFATPDAQFQSSTMPYLPDAAGITMINYATEPLARRMGALVPAAAQLPPISGASVSSCHVNTADCMDGTHAWEVRNPIIGLATSGLAPWTPIVDAQQGQPVVLRVLGASGDQLATVHVDGHFFATDPEMGDCRNVLSTCRSNVVSTVTLGAREGRNLWIPAAGPAGPGDYMYRNHRDAYFEAGGWGLLRVHGPTTVPLPQLPMPLPVPVPGQVTLPTV
ncbi:MAG TPA: hypothetical protein VM370_07710, partial [Candidatus Thermoplasmatota archaeon]|nr:hypothetical protein [Candidatus Thermoplasmatota archaeon]